MAVAFRSYSQSLTTSASSLTFTLPSGAQVGDFLVFLVGIPNAIDELARSSIVDQRITDWTTGGTGTCKVQMFTRFYDGSNGSFGLSVYDGSGTLHGICMAFSGVNPTHPIGGFVYALNGVDTGTIDIPAVKNKITGAMAVAAYIARGTGTATFTHPSGYTEIVDEDSNSTNRRAIGAATLIVNEGDVPATTATWGIAEPNIGIHLLLNPAEVNLVTTDWKFPTSSTHVSATTIGLADSNDWTNPGNAISSNNSRARCSGNTSGFDGDLLKLTGFGHTVPPGATIAGIEIEVEGFSSYSADPAGLDAWVQVSSAIYRAGTAESYIRINNMKWLTQFSSLTDQLQTVGGMGDVWNANWTKADVEHSDFGCYLLPQLTTQEAAGGGGQVRMDVDAVRMRLHLILPPPLDAIV